MILDFLLKQNFIKIVPIEDTYFHCITFTGEKKLSYDSIIFNYQKFSPFVESCVSYIQKDGHIYLWFYEKKYDSLCTLPEGYLHYQYFLKQKKDLIGSIKDKSVSVIKNGVLLYQSHIKDISKQELELLSKNYQISSIENKTYNWYEENIKNIRNQPLIPIFRYFIDREKLLKYIKQKLSELIVPSMILLLILTGIKFATNQYLQQKIEKYNIQKNQTRRQTKKIFDNIKINNQNKQIINKYINKYNNNKINVLDTIAKFSKKAGFRLFYVQYNIKTISLNAQTKSIDPFLEELSTINTIESFKVIRQIKQKNQLLSVGIDINLKLEKK